MKPWQNIASATAPDGTLLELVRRDDEWVVRAAGRTLMTSRTFGSEQALAAFALAGRRHPQTVLIGGLGLGYTLRAALDLLSSGSRVLVLELVAELAAWNRGPVAHLTGHALDDPRVELRIGDVTAQIAKAREQFDAILLDVDNGPSAIILSGNRRLYDRAGIRRCYQALRPGGVLAVWSTGPDAAYVAALARAGFEAESRRVQTGHGGKGVRHVLFLGRKPAVSPAAARSGGGRARRP
jgi:spermidine synthase